MHLLKFARDTRSGFKIDVLAGLVHRRGCLIADLTRGAALRFLGVCGSGEN
jgi:hypothetical protein